MYWNIDIDFNIGNYRSDMAVSGRGNRLFSGAILANGRGGHETTL